MVVVATSASAAAAVSAQLPGVQSVNPVPGSAVEHVIPLPGKGRDGVGEERAARGGDDARVVTRRCRGRGRWRRTNSEVVEEEGAVLAAAGQEQRRVQGEGHA